MNLKRFPHKVILEHATPVTPDFAFGERSGHYTVGDVRREPTPTEILAARIADMEARLQLADERAFYLVAEIARLNAALGRTDYVTQPIHKNQHHHHEPRT